MTYFVLENNTVKRNGENKINDIFSRNERTNRRRFFHEYRLLAGTLTKDHKAQSTLVQVIVDLLYDMLELHNKQIVCKTSFSRSLLTQNSERNVAVFSTLVTGGGSVGECGRLRVNPGGFWPHYNILLYLLTYLPSLRHFVLLRGTLSCYPMHVTLLKF